MLSAQTAHGALHRLTKLLSFCISLAGCGSDAREPSDSGVPTGASDSGVPSVQELTDTVCVKLNEQDQECRSGTDIFRQRTVENGVVKVQARIFPFGKFRAPGRCGCRADVAEADYFIGWNLEIPEGVSMPYALRNGTVECQKCQNCSCDYGGAFVEGGLTGTVYRLDPSGFVAHIEGFMKSPNAGMGSRCFAWCNADGVSNPPVPIVIDISIPF